MDYNLLSNIEYCKEIVDSYASFLYYSHIPAAVVSLLLGVYVFIKNRKEASAPFLFILSIVFASWTFVDLMIWLTYDQATPMMFLWSLIGILSSLLFIFTLFFIFAFVTGRKLPRWMIISACILLLPVIIFTPTSYNLESFDILDCVAIEGTWFLYYYHALGLIVALALPLTLFFRRKNEHALRIPLSASIFAIIGAELFVVTFLITSFLASYLVNAGIVPDFGLEQYGIMTMAVFMAFLSYLIVQYHAFNLKLLGAQALVIGLVILIISQFLFIEDTTGYWLAFLTAILVIFFGIILVRGVKKEIQQRERIEVLAEQLEHANKQQVVLLRFITHQVKGFLTRSRNVFSMLVDGDYGPISDQVKKIVEAGFESDTKGVTMVQEILNAANIRNGTVQYAMAAFDFSALIEEVVEDLRAGAEAKGLTLTFHPCPHACQIEGDRPQLQNAIKNLIDNSIKYTLKGQVDVTLDPKGEMLRLTVKDTGVGITPEDMKYLFTEGGHGRDSQKVNVESTGYGLYIVKSIIEAHKGKVWAESEGEGKGASFIVELPHHAVQS